MRPEAVETYCEREQLKVIAKISKQLVVAAATEDNHYRQDYYPSAVVIVKNVT